MASTMTRPPRKTLYQTIETLCGSDGTLDDATRIAALMNDVLRPQGIRIAIAAVDSPLLDSEEVEATLESAWNKAIHILASDGRFTRKEA